MKNRFLKFIIGASFVLFFSCNLVAGNKAPYIINGEMVLDSSSKYEAAGFEFFFLNKSIKDIKSFTIVFFMFDDEGNPPCSGQNNIVITVSSPVKAECSLSGCVSLDSYITEIPENPYTVDYLYVSKILYEDGTSWTDPFGLQAF